jgi:hypothetical protein
MDCTTPRRSQSLLYASDVYSAPRSLWKIVPSRLPPRVTAAIFNDAPTRAAS